MFIKELKINFTSNYLNEEYDSCIFTYYEKFVGNFSDFFRWLYVDPKMSFLKKLTIDYILFYFFTVLVISDVRSLNAANAFQPPAPKPIAPKPPVS